MFENVKKEFAMKTGIDNPIFQSPVITRPVVIGNSAEKKATRVIGWVDERASIRVGVQTIEDEVATIYWDAGCCGGKDKPSGFSLMVCYRTFLLMQAVPDLEGKFLWSVHIAALNPDLESAWTRVSGSFKEEHRALLKAVPSNVDELLLNLHAHGVEMSLPLLTEEVRAGRLQYTDALNEIGVVHPDEVDRKAAEEAAWLGQFTGIFREHLSTDTHAAGCDCFEQMQSVAFRVRTNGIDDKHVVASLAIFFNTHQILGYVPQLSDTQMHNLAGSMALAARFVSEYFHEGVAADKIMVRVMTALPMLLRESCPQC